MQTVVDRQKGFLEGFAKAFEEGRYKDREKVAQHRAEMYADATIGTWWMGHTRGWPLPAWPGDGTTQCKTRCRCSWDIRQLGGEGNADAHWLLGNVDHCQTCEQRAEEWAPIRIRDGELPSEITTKGWVTIHGHPVLLGDSKGSGGKSSDGESLGLTKARAVEKEIQGQPTETMVVLGHDGKERLKMHGDEAHVEFGPEEAKTWQGAIVTHNHPRGYAPLAHADIRNANAHGADEIRAVNAKGRVFSLRYNNKHVPEKDFDTAWREVYKGVDDDASSGKLRKDPPYPDYDDDLPRHLDKVVAMRLAKKMGWTYSEEKVGDPHRTDGTTIP